jgi:DNA (cytosine-5)-methyltransferase 1
MKISAVDLFCGVGGLTQGLKLGGVEVVAGIDINHSVKSIYEHNNNAKFIEKSVDLLEAEEIAKLYPENTIRLLAGCAPCQPFSSLNAGKQSQDKNWTLVSSFGKLVSTVKPELVTMENVIQLLKHDVYKEFEAILDDNGYYVSSNIVYCPDYGIPQKRKRLVLMASKYGAIKLIPKTHIIYNTVKDAIGHLPPLNAGGQNADDLMHRSSSISELNLKRLKHSTPNGSWQDWPDELVSPCHKRMRIINFSSAYGRMAWDEPSPTITTQFFGISHGRFGHPEQDRALSLREGAILQTFPEDYNFFPQDNSQQAIARMIGNAVPVQLAKVVALSFFQHLKEVSHDRI